MGVLDEHNRQHTYGNSMGLPTTVVGVSAQQSIDAHNRLVENAGKSVASGGQPIDGRDSLKLAIVFAVATLVLAIVAYMVGGVGAFAIGLIAFGSGIFCAVFAAATLIHGLKAIVAALLKR